jgi:hypothetical protein
MRWTIYCGVSGHTDRVLYNANLCRRPYVDVAIAQSASANSGRMLPATEREDHETIKGNNTALFLSYGLGPSCCPLSLQREEKVRERGKGVAIVAVLAEDGGGAGGVGIFDTL